MLETHFSRRQFAVRCGGAATAYMGAANFDRPLWAQSPASPIVLEDPYLFLIRQARVQTELELRGDQKSAVRQATDEVDGALFLMRDLPLAQRAEKTKPLTLKVREKMQRTLSRLQRQRLDQIVAQAQGHRALMRESMGRQLKLTASQRNELLEIAQETEKEKRKLSEKAKQGAARQDLQKELTELMQREQKQFISALSATQRPRLNNLFGATFTIDRNVLPHVKPPKIPLNGPWINSEPLTLDKLKGKVVALHFYAFA